MPPLGAVGLIRRDGRMLHDLVARTGIIYLWDAKLAKMRQKAMQLERSESNMTTPDEEEVDELDNLMGEEVEDDTDGEAPQGYSTFV